MRIKRFKMGQSKKTTKTSKATTTNSSPTILQSIPIKPNRVYGIRTIVLAKRTGGSSGDDFDSAMYVFNTMYNTHLGILNVHEVTSDKVEYKPTWDASMTTSGSNAVVQVTGAAGSNIDWQCTSEIAYV